MRRNDLWRLEMHQNHVWPGPNEDNAILPRPSNRLEMQISYFIHLLLPSSSSTSCSGRLSTSASSNANPGAMCVGRMHSISQSCWLARWPSVSIVRRSFLIAVSVMFSNFLLTLFSIVYLKKLRRLICSQNLELVWFEIILHFPSHLKSSAHPPHLPSRTLDCSVFFFCFSFFSLYLLVR